MNTSIILYLMMYQDYSDNQKNEFLNLARTSLKKNGTLLWCDKNTLN